MNKEKRKEYMREYQKKYRPKHREQRRKYAKKYHQKLKLKVFEKLGNKCANPNCPIPRDKLDLRALQIDHINGHGRQELKELGSNSAKYYNKILVDTKGNYQLLCANCNWINGLEKRRV